MFDYRAPYGAALAENFIGNTNQRIENQMRVSGYHLPTNEYAVSNQQ